MKNIKTVVKYRKILSYEIKASGFNQTALYDIISCNIILYKH